MKEIRHQGEGEIVQKVCVGFISIKSVLAAANGFWRNASTRELIPNLNHSY